MSGYEARVKIYTTEAELPASAFEGQIAYTQDTDIHYYWDGSAWTAMGGGSGTNITLDLGDDGGNDSAALSEIATANDDYGVVTEPSADKMLIDFAKVPPYRKYDPDRPPSQCAICEEFIGDTESESWRWQSQGTATISYSLDQALIADPAGTNDDLRVRWVTGPDGSATDWVATMKVTQILRANSSSVGIGVLAAGTEEAPTSIYVASLRYTGAAGDTGDLDMLLYSRTSYTSATTIVANDTTMLNFGGYRPFWIQLRYASSTKTLTPAWSLDGYFFFNTSASYTTTLGAHPTTSVGIVITNNSSVNQASARIHYFRVRTDAAGTAPPYPCGE